MFDSIVFKKSLPGNTKVDVGLLAECMLFYDKVLVVADTSMIRLIINKIGLETFEELINNNHFKLMYSPAVSATYTTSEFTENECFDFVSVLKVDQASKKPDYEQLFHEALHLGSGKRGKSRRVGNRLLGKIDFVDYKNPIPLEKGIHEISRVDLTKQNFTKSAVEIAIKNFAPTFNLPSNFEFKVKRHERGFDIFTNLDLSLLNKSCSRLHFPDPKTVLSRALLVDCILKANEDLFLASHYESEIITGTVPSEIISLKCKDIIQKSTGSTESFELFQKITFSEAKTIREVINSGEKTIKDLVPLLEKSKRFKSWVHGKPPEANLIREYYQAINENSWIDKLPGKVTRFSIFTGAGIALDSFFTGGIATASGLTLGLGDAFILDKLLKGWRPNQFVDELSDYVK